METILAEAILLHQVCRDGISLGYFRHPGMEGCIKHNKLRDSRQLLQANLDDAVGVRVVDRRKRQAQLQFLHGQWIDPGGFFKICRAMHKPVADRIDLYTLFFQEGDDLLRGDAVGGKVSHLRTSLTIHLPIDDRICLRFGGYVFCFSRGYHHRLGAVGCLVHFKSLR